MPKLILINFFYKMLEIRIVELFIIIVSCQLHNIALFAMTNRQNRLETTLNCLSDITV